MAPHDLLCKWCSTFVGRGKKFCSIFCEARFTKNRRRKYITRRPSGAEYFPETDPLQSCATAVQSAPAVSDGLIEALASNTKSSSQRYTVQKNSFSSEYCSKCDKVTSMDPFPDFVTDMTSVLSLQKPLSAPRQTKTAAVLARRVRSSGYGAPVNPKLRPMALKPRSATMRPSRREGSAKSAKSSKEIFALPDLLREESPGIETGRGADWELVTTIVEEAQTYTPTSEEPQTLANTVPTSATTTEINLSLEDNLVGLAERSNKELLLRELTEDSDNLDDSLLQERLTSIKRKVETVRRRGPGSQASMASETDTWPLTEEGFYSDAKKTSPRTTYAQANTSSSQEMTYRADRAATRKPQTKLI